MNIGIFGGTFNPVHKGHVESLQKILAAVDLDKVLVLPDRIPPHKSAEELVSGEEYPIEGGSFLFPAEKGSSALFLLQP